MFATLLVCARVCHADDTDLTKGLVSEAMTLKVTIGAADFALDAYVTRPDRPGRLPLVIMVSGTPGSEGPEFARDLANRSPVVFNRAAIAFAQRGYAVVSVLRRGFGRSQGSYQESLGLECDFLSAARNSAQDVAAALVTLRSEPWVDPDHVLLLGLSTGGLAVIAAAAANPPGVVGVLDFAGGRHGRTKTGAVCHPEKMVQTMSTLGLTAKIPALWIYADNDKTFSPVLARQMFDAYVAGGAPAELNVLPGIGSDGHDLVVESSADSWLPTVGAFLETLRLPMGLVVTLPAIPGLAVPVDMSSECQARFVRYASYRSNNKAFASDSRRCGAAVGRTLIEAREEAMAICIGDQVNSSCAITALGQHVLRP
jgi:dienelactone hydrolase